MLCHFQIFDGASNTKGWCNQGPDPLLKLKPSHNPVLTAQIRSERISPSSFLMRSCRKGGVISQILEAIISSSAAICRSVRCSAGCCSNCSLASLVLLGSLRGSARFTGSSNFVGRAAASVPVHSKSSVCDGREVSVDSLRSPRGRWSRRGSAHEL